MKLIPMTDYVLVQERFKEDSDTAIFKVTVYANFLKLPLKLAMFIPCDENDVPLEEPKDYRRYLQGNMFAQEGIEWKKCDEFRQAKDRIFFKGFKSNYYSKEEGYCSVSNERFEFVFDLDHKDSEVSVEHHDFTDKIRILEDLTINRFFTNPTENYNLSLTSSAIKIHGI